MPKQITHSKLETERFAAQFAKTLAKGSVLLLIGDLGSGKTTFVQGLAKGLKIPKEVIVHSPSFTLINEYPGKIPLYHIDLYRLGDRREIDDLGLEDYLDKGGIVAVEWADRALSVWPKEAITIQFKILPSHKREITVFDGIKH
jgi:tRNA threonylcarbamoyladenosine biosynthesis protein TsaE